MRIGVPSRARRFSFRIPSFETRTQPCDTASPRSQGMYVPWIPTTPPPGHSDSFE